MVTPPGPVDEDGDGSGAERDCVFVLVATRAAVASCALPSALFVESLACVDSDGFTVVVTVMKDEPKVKTKVRGLTLVTPERVERTAVPVMASESCGFVGED